MVKFSFRHWAGPGLKCQLMWRKEGGRESEGMGASEITDLTTMLIAMYDLKLS